MATITHLSWMRFVRALLMAAAASAAGAQPIVPASAGAWLMFLCQASDNASTPHPASWYQELFDTTNPDMLDAYFKEMSFGKVGVKGSRVFGWFRTNTSTAVLNARSNVTRHLKIGKKLDSVLLQRHGLKRSGLNQIFKPFL